MNATVPPNLALTLETIYAKYIGSQPNSCLTRYKICFNTLTMSLLALACLMVVHLCNTIHPFALKNLMRGPAGMKVYNQIY